MANAPGMFDASLIGRGLFDPATYAGAFDPDFLLPTVTVTGTPISATSQVAMEWLLGIRQTQADSEEWERGIATTGVSPWAAGLGVSASRAGPWEALLGVRQSQAGAEEWKKGLAVAGASAWEHLLGVVATRAAAEEWLLAVLATRADAWESRLGVLSTSAAAWEHLLAILATRIVPWSSGLGIAATRQSATESLLGVLASRQVPEEWTLALTAARAVAWEHGLAVSASRAVAIESALSVLGTRAVATESLLRLIVTSPTAWEHLLSISQSQIGAEEWRGLLTASASAAWEHLLGTIAVGVVPWTSGTVLTTAQASAWEALLAVRQSQIGVVESILGLSTSTNGTTESLQGLERTADAAWEHLLAVFAEVVSPTEVEGVALAAAQAAEWEALATVRTVNTAPIETLLRVVRSRDIVSEALLGLAVEGSAAWESQVRTTVVAAVAAAIEWLAGRRVNGGAPIEYRGWLTSSRSVSVETLRQVQRSIGDAWEAQQRVQQARSGNAEWLTRIATPAALGMEWRGLLTVNGTAATERLLSRMVIGSGSWEHGIGLRVSATTSAEWLLGLLAPQDVGFDAHRALRFLHLCMTYASGPRLQALMASGLRLLAVSASGPRIDTVAASGEAVDSTFGSAPTYTGVFTSAPSEAADRAESCP